MARILILLLLLLVCLAAVPLGPNTPRIPSVHRAAADTNSASPLTASQFAELAKSDILAMLQASMNRYRADVRGYNCTLHKQERVKGTLGKVEIIDVAFRDDPFAVYMKWQQGAGLASATLFAKGENNGNLKAKSLLGIQDSDPNGFFARQSSRFSIHDFGIYRGTLRTYQTWNAAHDRGKLQVEHLGTKPIPECNNRVCHVIRRTCDPWEVDSFSIAEPEVRSAVVYPKEAILQATIVLDAETFLHVGSDIRHPDGSLIAAYYFRDIRLNPTFDREQFLPSILKK